MPKPPNQPVLKVVGSNGTISLGKRYAGRKVLLKELEPGVLLVRTLPPIPDSERWLHEPEAAECIREALAWATANPVREGST